MYSCLLTILAFLIATGWSTTTVWAGSFERPEAIRKAVQAAAEQVAAPTPDQTLQIEVGDIDSRIRVAECPALEVEIPTVNAPLLSARVSCREPFWTLYVPVRVHAWGRAVVAAANLAPGTRLSAADLTVAQLDILTTNGAYLTDPQQAEGMILRSNIRAGAPIVTALLDLPVVVHRGDTVVLTLLDSTITIRSDVIAMEDGRVGDHITVQNPDSKKVIRAAVVNAGAVEIRFDQGRENY